ncbi:MAG: hypothetical protein [Siphoviridae sp. ctdEk19]|nr:MAG: hypothetical protein [Siphoviridae sp. ctdEk19]
MTGPYLPAPSGFPTSRSPNALPFPFQCPSSA